MATINYVLNAVNKMSGPLDEAAAAVTRLDTAEKSLGTSLEKLDFQLQIQAEFANAASDSLLKYGMTADEVTAQELALATAVDRTSAAIVRAQGKVAAATAATNAAMEKTNATTSGFNSISNTYMAHLEKVAEEEDIAALQNELFNKSLSDTNGLIVTELGAFNQAAFALDEYSNQIAETVAEQDKLAVSIEATRVMLAKRAEGGGGGGGGGAAAGGFFAGFGGFGFGLLTGTVKLFGGLTPIFASVAAWHLLADVILETAAILVPATIAMAAFGIAGSDAATTIFHHMSDLHTVMDATGRAIPPMTGALEALHKAVAPAVYQLFGDALTIMKDKTGEFAILAKGTATVVDQLGARLTVAITSGHGFSDFMKNAVGDVFKLGTVIGNLLGVIGAILKDLPGFAQAFLNAAVEVTHFAEVLANGTGGLITFLLWAHGLILWSGLAVTALLLLQGPLSRLGLLLLAGVQAIEEFIFTMKDAVIAEGFLGAATAELAAVNPLVWVGIAAAAIGILTYAIINSKDQTQKWTAALNDAVLNAPTLAKGVADLTFAIHAQGNALAEVNRQIANVPGLNTKLAGGANPVSVARQYGAAVADLVFKQKDLTAAQVASQGEANLYSYRLAQVAKTVGGTAQAQVFLTQSGVSMNQMLKYGKENLLQIEQQAYATKAGFGALAYTGTQWSNDVEVMDQQLQSSYVAVTNLNAAWDTFIGNLTGAQSAFVTFAQGLKQIPATAATAARALASAQSAVLTAQQRVNTLSGGGGPSGLSVTAATDRLRAAQQALAAVEANPAAHAAGVLADAQARVASAQNTLNNLTHGGTTATGSLTAAQDRLTAAQNRLNALQKAGKPTIDGLNAASLQMNQQFTQSVVNVNAMIDTWRRANISNSLFTQGIKDSISLLVPYARGSQTATAELAALAQEAGYKGPASLKTLTQWLGNTHDALKRVQQIADQATIQESLLTGAMDAQTRMITNKLLGAITDAILAYSGVNSAAKAYGKALAEFGPQSQQAQDKQHALNQAIIDGGLASGKTMTQIAAMIAQVDKIPLKKAMQIVMTGTGSFTVKDLGGGRMITSTGQVRGGGGHTGSPGFLFAEGGFVRGGVAGKDSVTARVMPGEVIVPTAMVNAGAVDHLRGSLPGFAAGGLVGGAPAGNPSFGGDTSVLTGNYAIGVYNTMGSAMGQAMVAAMKTALKNAESMFGGSSGIVADAMHWLGKIPYVWGGTAVPGGADCSGFVQTIYGRHGIGAPRTSEAQGAWVKRSPPIPGGLAFYNSPAGGPPPGHVAIVGDNGKVISQGGGMGPQLESLNFAPLMFTGIPPGGLGGPTGTGGNFAIHGGTSLGALERLWMSANGPAAAAHIAGAIALAESGGNPNARNPSGASGLWQILGLPFPGNPFNPFTNAEMAVAKYFGAGSRFTPWVTFTDGAYRQFMGNGGIINEPVLGIGASGRQYVFGERGPETVTPGVAPSMGTSRLESLLAQLIREVQASPGRTGDSVGAALNGVARSSMYRGRYSTR